MVYISYSKNEKEKEYPRLVVDYALSENEDDEKLAKEKN
ncbi:hypothetical protein MBBAR_4c00320 [Methanobrevibacter arboriphilus JCM 13429 = DSM 1125]|uniref:Uncharacterized protein n=1 Tax=Methanobrevibacter arboriphilus JCM 13429 = DSM 1125 TaxID=1300164 RepID=A0A1V6N3Y6_METAZ|nr:hypothetical protein MBBAR_4c00320 [Methanobrevibacter arboriphilus JCM 13429 = DSM 1125]